MFKPLALTLLATSLLVSTAAKSAEKASVTVAAPWEITSYEPSISGFAFHRLQVMETLVDANSEGVLQPALATAWAADADGLSWRFILRKDVSFHNGNSLDAAIASGALNLALNKPGMLNKAPIRSIEADGNAVVITLEKPFSSLPSLLTHNTTVISAPASIDGNGKHIAAIGTGPFVVDSFSPPQSVSLKRFDNYWGKQAELESVDYLAVGRAETRALMAESGDADLVFTLDPSGYARLSRVDSVEAQAVAIPRVVLLKLNASHKFLDDARAPSAQPLSGPSWHSNSYHSLPRSKCNPDFPPRTRPMARHFTHPTAARRRKSQSAIGSTRLDSRRRWHTDP